MFLSRETSSELNPGQPVMTVPMVKEDGEWKLAFGKPKSGAKP
jgi:hypothetical protein